MSNVKFLVSEVQAIGENGVRKNADVLAWIGVREGKVETIRCIISTTIKQREI